MIAVSELISFDADSHLAANHDEITRVYFPVSGYASLVVSDRIHARMQIALVGSEGMLGWESLLGVNQFQFDVDVPEKMTALSVKIGDFSTLAAGNESGLATHHGYLLRLFDSVAIGAVCARFHLLEARLARFLLEVYDRHPGRPILLTQSTLASMLGVRRSGVTNAATHLQLAGLISYRRGEIRLLDRQGLETAACDCYRRSNGDNDGDNNRHDDRHDDRDKA